MSLFKYLFIGSTGTLGVSTCSLMVKNCSGDVIRLWTPSNSVSKGDYIYLVYKIKSEENDQTIKSFFNLTGASSGSKTKTDLKTEIQEAKQLEKQCKTFKNSLHYMVKDRSADLAKINKWCIRHKDMTTSIYSLFKTVLDWEYDHGSRLFLFNTPSTGDAEAKQGWVLAGAISEFLKDENAKDEAITNLFSLSSKLFLGRDKNAVKAYEYKKESDDSQTKHWTEYTDELSNFSIKS